MDLPARKPIRLKNYDYSAPGAYFITICTRDKRCILSEIIKSHGGNVGDGALAVPHVLLSETGAVVDEVIRSMEDHYPYISVDSYVIMPNHIHLIVRITEAGPSGAMAPTRAVIPSFVSTLKGLTVRRCGEKLWQRSFYDHIIRNDDDCRQIAEYIAANPARWKTGPPPPGADQGGPVFPQPPGADQGGPVFPQPRHWRAESEAGPPMASAARWTEDRFYPET